jgi:hypothetical protein
MTNAKDILKNINTLAKSALTQHADKASATDALASATDTLTRELVNVAYFYAPMLAKGGDVAKLFAKGGQFEKLKGAASYARTIAGHWQGWGAERVVTIPATKTETARDVTLTVALQGVVPQSAIYKAIKAEEKARHETITMHANTTAQALEAYLEAQGSERDYKDVQEAMLAPVAVQADMIAKGAEILKINAQKAEAEAIEQHYQHAVEQALIVLEHAAERFDMATLTKIATMANKHAKALNAKAADVAKSA